MSRAAVAAILAQTTARLLHWSKDQETWVAAEGRAGDYVDHNYQLCFEIATDVLTRLGLTQHVRGPFYQLLVDVDDAEAFANAVAPHETPPIDEMISAFLGMADQRGLIPMKPDAVFEAREACGAAMRALAAAGYAEEAGGLFTWREEIRPAMCLQHFWPASPGRS